VARSPGDDLVQQQAPVAAALPRAPVSSPRQRVALRWQVGRVGGDHVEASAGNRIEQAAAQRLDVQSVERRVQARREHRAPRQIDNRDRPCTGAGRKHGDHAASGTHIKDVENRWSAGRHGLAGTLADLQTGEPRPTRKRLRALLEWLAPAAARAGCLGALEAADRLVTANGSERQRQVAAEEGLNGLVGSLADRFLATET